MMFTAVTGIVDSLSDPRLLLPERYEELVTQLLPQCSEWSILGRELIYRGWLTPYQMREVLRGNSQSLFLGSYTLLEPLGEGGMGSVFRAQNWKLGKTVAVKVIRQEQVRDRRTVKRFFREIQTLGRVSHPNIVLAFDADFEDHRLFYAMEYIPGRDLGWKVREDGPLSIEAVCYFTAQIAHALQHVHESGFVHRDIKPSNLLLAQHELSIKLLDLGLSRGDLFDVEATQLTKIGSLIGTPDYIAPEQINDPHHVDIRADLYSLGCTVYYLLTGQAPFQHAEPVEKLYLHAKEDPEPIEQFRPDVPPELGSILRRLLAKRPKKRYQEPADLLGALLPLLQSSWNSSSTTIHDCGKKTSVQLKQVTVPVCDDEDRTEVLSPSEMDIYLPDTLNTTISLEKEAWFHPLQMAIAVVMATLAMIAVQVMAAPRKSPMPPPAPVRLISTNDPDAAIQRE